MQFVSLRHGPVSRLFVFRIIRIKKGREKRVGGESYALADTCDYTFLLRHDLVSFFMCGPCSMCSRIWYFSSIYLYSRRRYCGRCAYGQHMHFLTGFREYRQHEY